MGDAVREPAPAAEGGTSCVDRGVLWCAFRREFEPPQSFLCVYVAWREPQPHVTCAYSALRVVLGRLCQQHLREVLGRVNSSWKRCLTHSVSTACQQ